MGKATMQEIADELGISRVTVWKALTGKPGVSEDTIKKIIEVEKQLSSIKKMKKVPFQSFEAIENISIAVARLDTSFFWVSIVNTIAKELQKKGVNLVLTPINTHAGTYANRETMRTAIKNANTQGMIIINVYEEETIKFLSDIDIPKVYMDTLPHFEPEMIGGDLLIVEGNTSICKIMRRIFEKGYTKVGYIGDVNYAKSNVSRYLGFLSGIEEQGIAFKSVEDYCLLNANELGGYESGIKEHILSLYELGKIPEVFVCESDYAADLVVTELAKKGLELHRDILVTGFDNCPDFFRSTSPSATVDVNTEIVGQQLLHQLLFRIQFPYADFSDIYLRSKVKFFNDLA